MVGKGKADIGLSGKGRGGWKPRQMVEKDEEGNRV